MVFLLQFFALHFRMAFDHLHLHPTVDVVTAGNNIKKLLTLALTDSQGLSMLVHPIGRSLLLDNFDIHKWLMTNQPEWKWLREFFYREVLNSEEDLHKVVMRKSHTNDALVERNWMSKFLYYSLFHEIPQLETSSIDFTRKPEDPPEKSENESLANFPSLPNIPRLPKIEAVTNFEGLVNTDFDSNSANV